VCSEFSNKIGNIEDGEVTEGLLTILALDVDIVKHIQLQAHGVDYGDNDGVDVHQMRPSSTRPMHCWSAVRQALNCLQSAVT